VNQFFIFGSLSSKNTTPLINCAIWVQEQRGFLDKLPLCVSFMDTTQLNTQFYVSKFRNSHYLCNVWGRILQMRYFETRFMEEADKFISELDTKSIKNIL
jgi:hypothetical protein